MGRVVELVHEAQQQALAGRKRGAGGLGGARRGDLLFREPGALAEERRARGPFTSVDDLARRLPQLRKDELVMLAQIGALNSVASHLEKRETGKEKPPFHRRDALSKGQHAGRFRAAPFQRVEPLRHIFEPSGIADGGFQRGNSCA